MAVCFLICLSVSIIVIICETIATITVYNYIILGILVSLLSGKIYRFDRVLQSASRLQWSYPLRGLGGVVGLTLPMRARTAVHVPYTTYRAATLDKSLTSHCLYSL